MALQSFDFECTCWKLFQSFDFECTCWKLFKKRFVHIKLDLYVFIIRCQIFGISFNIIFFTLDNVESICTIHVCCIVIIFFAYTSNSKWMHHINKLKKKKKKNRFTIRNSRYGKFTRLNHFYYVNKILWTRNLSKVIIWTSLHL